MRGAPEVGFSATMRKINSRTSFGVCLRPIGLRTLEISFQYNRKPPRCHWTTVPGLTTISACFHPDQNLRAMTQNSLSNTASLGHACLRFSAASCWRRARFSRSSMRRVRNTRRIAPNRSLGVCHATLLRHFACEMQCCILLKSKADGILANDRTVQRRKHIRAD